MRDYNNLPDIRGMRVSEILFYYYGLREELIERTKPKGN